MKVLREGRGFQPIEMTCRKCDAHLASETPEDFARSRGGDQREYWDHAEAHCPCCGNSIIVEKERFPLHIYERLREAK